MNARKGYYAQQERRKAKDIQHQKAQLTPHFSPPCGTPVKFGVLVSGLAAVVQKRNAHKRCNAKQERRKAKDIYKQQAQLTPHFKPPRTSPIVTVRVRRCRAASDREINANERTDADRKSRDACAIKKAVKHLHPRARSPFSLSGPDLATIPDSPYAHEAYEYSRDAQDIQKQVKKARHDSSPVLPYAV